MYASHSSIFAHNRAILQLSNIVLFLHQQPINFDLWVESLFMTASLCVVIDYVVLILLSCKFTLLSNLSSTVPPMPLFYYPINLHYSQTTVYQHSLIFSFTTL